MDSQQENTNNAQAKQLLSLSQLSRTYETTDYMHFAAACHIQHLALCRALQNRTEEARILAQLGHAYDALGNVDEAIETCEHSLIIAREIGDRQTECLARATLGTAYIHLGYAHRALSEGEQSLMIAKELATTATNTISTVEPHLELTALQCLGDAHYALAQIEQAISWYLQGLEYARTTRELPPVLYEKLGLAYALRGEHTLALTHYTDELQRAGQVNALYSRGRIHAHLGDLYSVQQQAASKQGTFALLQTRSRIVSLPLIKNLIHAELPAQRSRPFSVAQVSEYG